MKKGFSLVELIAVIAIASLLIGLGIPSYIAVSKRVRQRNYDAKIIDITNQALKYANDNKNDIKKNSPVTITVTNLIEEGYLSSEDKKVNVIYNPITKEGMTETITLTYDINTNDVKVTINK